MVKSVGYWILVQRKRNRCPGCKRPKNNPRYFWIWCIALGDKIWDLDFIEECFKNKKKAALAARQFLRVHRSKYPNCPEKVPVKFRK